MRLQRTIQRVLSLLRSRYLFRQQPPDERRDPYAWRPVPRRPRPNPRSGAVAVAEPDE
jgi:hypothetical protein